MTKNKTVETVTTEEINQIAKMPISDHEAARLGANAVPEIGNSIAYEGAVYSAWKAAKQIMDEGQAEGKNPSLVGQEVVRTVVGMALQVGMRVGYLLHAQDVKTAKAEEPE